MHAVGLPAQRSWMRAQTRTRSGHATLRVTARRRRVRLPQGNATGVCLMPRCPPQVINIATVHRIQSESIRTITFGTSRANSRASPMLVTITSQTEKGLAFRRSA